MYIHKRCLPGWTENLPGYCRAELMTAALKMNASFDYFDVC